MTVNKYTAITFAPVQGFIEKSRKLRDLYGASLILSYLSQQLVLYVENSKGLTLISPAIPNLQKGMPNRILIEGEVSKEDAEKIILSAWKNILQVCRTWIEDNVLNQYHWEREWTLWGVHTWEIFQGNGDTIEAAMKDLETRKLSRDWTAVNWIGESSSLTGTDAIAFPGLGAETRNPKNMNYGNEKKQIEDFYQKLAAITEEESEENPEGKFIAPNEKLSILELVKRLITWHKIQEKIGIEALEKGFKEIQRKPTEDTPGQWTGWFMGDGDKVGDYLQKLEKRDNPDQEIQKFSHKMRDWGKQFNDKFNLHEKIGRVVYAGVDDFLGIIYSKNPAKSISPLKAYEWLMTINDKWQEHKQPITVSVGFVWVAGSVPQRDVLQHCREAEKVAKSLGRDRVTIRVVFNSGQYVQWTCPWKYLDILTKYRDRDGKTFSEWECNGRDEKYFPNWSHVYSDLAQLKARHAIKLNARKNNVDQYIALKLFNLYFQSENENKLENNQKEIVGKSDSLELIKWIDGLIHIGWHLCSSI